jgi:hypothetical protein
MMWRALRFCLLAVCATLVGAGAFQPCPAAAALRINEVLAAPGSDWDGDLETDSKQDEWIEIANTGPADADMAGLFLLTGEAKAVVYGFSGVLAAGGHLVVYGSDAVRWESDNGQSSIGLSLNNSGDMVWLAEISGADTTVQDSMSFTSSQVGYDVSAGRMPDGSGPWLLCDHFHAMGGSGGDPTPSASNSSNAAPHVLGITRALAYPTADDSVRVTVEAGDATGIETVLLAYQLHLEDGEQPEMQLVSGTADLGVWSYAIPPCAPDDTVRYRALVYDTLVPEVVTVTPWIGYRVRSGGLTVRINEILADPPSDAAGDANGDGVRDSADDEFVELVNCGPTSVDMGGWKLTDGLSVRHTFPDTGMVVSPGEYVTVFGGGSPAGFSGKVFTASTGGLSLTNTGDAVSVLDRSGEMVDIYTFASEANKDQSLVLSPDCTGQWMLASQAGLSVPFTPHRPNTPAAVTPTTWGTIKVLFR